MPTRCHPEVVVLWWSLQHVIIIDTDCLLITLLHRLLLHLFLDYRFPRYPTKPLFRLITSSSHHPRKPQLMISNLPPTSLPDDPITLTLLILTRVIHRHRHTNLPLMMIRLLRPLLTLCLSLLLLLLLLLVIEVEQLAELLF